MYQLLVAIKNSRLLIQQLINKHMIVIVFKKKNEKEINHFFGNVNSIRLKHPMFFKVNFLNH
jgi:hypothetical protein